MAAVPTAASSPTPAHRLLPEAVRPVVMGWVRDPLVRGFTGFPLALAAVPMALVGAGRRAAARQVRMAEGYGSRQQRQAPEQPSGPGPARSRGPDFIRVIAHSVTVFLPSLVAFFLAVLFVYGIGAGYLYPLRPDAISAIGHPFSADRILNTSWGGPTLVGAWLAHSAVTLGGQIVCLGLLRGLTALQGRATRRFLSR